MKPDPFSSTLHDIDHFIGAARDSARDAAISKVREVLAPFNLKKRRIYVQGMFLHVDDVPYWDLRNNEDNPMLLALWQAGHFIEQLHAEDVKLGGYTIQEPA